MANHRNFTEKYKDLYETYGMSITGEVSGVGRNYVARFARENGWKAPTTAEVRANVVKLILSK